jgi:hypothetical protein
MQDNTFSEQYSDAELRRSIEGGMRLVVFAVTANIIVLAFCYWLLFMNAGR